MGAQGLLQLLAGRSGLGCSTFTSSTQASNAAQCFLHSTLGRTSFQEKIKQHKEGSHMTLTSLG